MGSYVHLSVGPLEVDWGKNEGFADHSSLFQSTDLTKVPYRYADNVVQRKMGLSKQLSEVSDRLRLLGHTPVTAQKELRAIARLNGLSEDDYHAASIIDAIAKLDVERTVAVHPKVRDFAELVRCAILPTLGLAEDEDDFEYSSLGAVMRGFSASAILSLLALNKSNTNLPVTWQFSDIVAGGYARRRDFVRNLDSSDQFLIVTEGSSDSSILRHGFRLFMPHLADFFRFVDMEEGYPFTGTGNLFRFTQGLIGIGIENKIVVLYDNDAEGVASYRRTSKLRRMPNMAVLKLPDLSAFRRFPTTGPHGKKSANINGRAAAIECYLDVGRQPIVRWTTFNGSVGRYQGELVNKGRYVKQFLSLKKSTPEYDDSKIRAVLSSIVAACSEVGERLRLANLKSW